MPYSKASRLKAKEYVATIRYKTSCEKCGNQPIEWHHIDHESNPNHRVARLTALGFPIVRIQKEIDKCEALCRYCHMTEDNRLSKLQENKPCQKGIVIVEPVACNKCHNMTKPSWKGMCRGCYDSVRRGFK